MNVEFRRYVNRVGGPEKAREALGCSLSLVYHMLNGTRNVSRDTAQKIVEKHEGFDIAKLLFPEDGNG